MNTVLTGWALVLGVIGLLTVFALVGSVLFGLMWALLLRKHHNRHLRVALGAAAYFMGLCVFSLMPAILMPSAGPRERWLPLAVVLGTVFWLWITRAGSAHVLPLIGGPISTWQLALERFYLAGAQRRIAKLEAVQR